MFAWCRSGYSFSRGCHPAYFFMNFRSLAVFMGLLSASSAIIYFFSEWCFHSFCESLIRFLSFCFTSFNLFLESSSSFLFLGVVKQESFNEVNDTILDFNWFISLLEQSWDGFHTSLSELNKDNKSPSWNDKLNLEV